MADIIEALSGGFENITVSLIKAGVPGLTAAFFLVTFGSGFCFQAASFANPLHADMIFYLGFGMSVIGAAALALRAFRRPA
jgi:hypothetical protein